MKRILVLLTALTILVSALALAVIPAAAELPACDTMPINYTHAHDFQGWGHYLVSLGWGEHPGAAQYKVIVTPPGVTFGPTPAGWNWLAVPADWFRDWGVLEVVVIALDADGNELCYTRSAVGPLELTAWNPPEAPSPPLPDWLTGAMHKNAGPAPDKCAADTGRPDGCACTADAECAASCDLNKNQCSEFCTAGNGECGKASDCCSGFCVTGSTKRCLYL